MRATDFKLVKKLRLAVREYGMLSGGVIVALSGGADSRALFHALLAECRSADIPIMCAHVNHMLRGSEADGDEEFCRRICAECGVEIAVLKTDVAAIAKARGKGFEEAAREVRYSFFAELLKNRPEFSHVATAHTASDNGETVLFNLSRGGGIKGLCGIPPVRDNIVRPLIYVTRGEVLEYCEKNGLDFVTDSTNCDTAYSRNYIRAEIMPRLDTLFGGFAEAAARASRSLRRDADYLEKESERVFAELYCGGLPSDELRRLHPAVRLRVIALALARVSEKKAESVHLEAVNELLERGKEPFSLDLPSVTCRCERGKLIFEKGKKGEKTVYRIPLVIGENELPDGSKLAIFPSCHSKNTEIPQNVYNLAILARVCGDTIKKGVYARSRENGDAYRFGNMTRRLKKLLCDKKIPIDKREKLPVVCDAEGIVWVPHFAVRDGAAAKNDGNDYDIYYVDAENA